MTNNIITSDGTSTATDLSTAPITGDADGGDLAQIDAVEESHPLVQETGEAALETDTTKGAGEFLSDYIYQNDEAWPREWLQNHETACIRAAKLAVKMSSKYPEGWLENEMWVDSETGETVIGPDEDRKPIGSYGSDGDETLRCVTTPKPVEEVLDAAKTLGYEPQIRWDVHVEERRIVTVDNGIGMTPKEFDKAFNTIFASGSGVDEETGGKFGVGSESVALATGKEGRAICETRSRRPKAVDGEPEPRDGFCAYTYLGGANALPGDLEDGFYGTRFTIPVADGFDLSNLQQWVEDYSDMLRVPVLYREHSGGSIHVEEEYPATSFTQKYADCPIVVERPGFSVAAGPEAVPNTRYNEPNEPNTYLVSMKIERNSPTRVRTMWDEVVQLNDEQGLIVSGPHRGMHKDEVDSLHEDDVALPEPTGDRDRLETGDVNEDFFNFIEKFVTEREIELLHEVFENKDDLSHPGLCFDEAGWRVWSKVVSKHAPYKARNRERKFKRFTRKKADMLPDFSDTEVQQLFDFFTEASKLPQDASVSDKHTSKTRRPESRLGKLIATARDNNRPTYIAASTSGKFIDRARVARNTDEDAEIIVLPNGSYYEKLEAFGFTKLKNVPVEGSKEHDYFVPGPVESRTKRQRKEKQSPDSAEDKQLKIRCDADNKKIDKRKKVSRVKKAFGNDRANYKVGNRNLVLFRRSDDRNLSDHYDWQKDAAIASATNAVYDELSSISNVYTPQGFMDWSKSATFWTADGTKTAEELVADDRHFAMLYTKGMPQEAEDMRDEFRRLLAEDSRDQLRWRRFDDYDKDDKPEAGLAVGQTDAFKRASLYLREKGFEGHVSCLRLSLHTPSCSIDTHFLRLDGDKERYRLMADTPKWDNDSNIYNVLTETNGASRGVLLGLHDRGINPAGDSTEEVRELVSNL